MSYESNRKWLDNSIQIARFQSIDQKDVSEKVQGKAILLAYNRYEAIELNNLLCMKEEEFKKKFVNDVIQALDDVEVVYSQKHVVEEVRSYFQRTWSGGNQTETL